MKRGLNTLGNFFNFIKCNRINYCQMSGECVKNQATYGNDLIKLHELNTWADFAYLWTESDISNPNNFFANPETGQYTKFEIGGEMRKIQSINFFKDNIQPTWEYGDNSKGGYFNFSLVKQTKPEIVKQIYQLLVFMVMGSENPICQRLKGVRIIDTSAKKKFRCRFEIWLDYQDEIGNLDMIKEHAHLIKQVLQANTEVTLNDIKFFNIGGKVEQHNKNEKGEKNGHSNGK